MRERRTDDEDEEDDNLDEEKAKGELCGGKQEWKSQLDDRGGRGRGDTVGSAERKLSRTRRSSGPGCGSAGNGVSAKELDSS
jgi:hypothetical protein